MARREAPPHPPTTVDRATGRADGLSSVGDMTIDAIAHGKLGCPKVTAVHSDSTGRHVNERCLTISVLRPRSEAVAIEATIGLLADSGNDPVRLGTSDVKATGCPANGVHERSNRGGTHPSDGTNDPDNVLKWR